VCEPERKKQRNDPKIVDNTFPLQRPRAAHALRFDQKIKYADHFLNNGACNSHGLSNQNINFKYRGFSIVFIVF
jgi:hypothetical protein